MEYAPNQIILQAPLAKKFERAYISAMDTKEIKQIRRWFDLSLKEMGERIGAHYSTLSLIETGARSPTANQLAALTKMKARMMKQMRAELHRSNAEQD